MEFYTSFSEKRPVRLCEKTRAFAYEALYEHRYGKENRIFPCIHIHSCEDFNKLSYIQKYDKAVRLIAEKAPIRVCTGEKISCSATLGDSIDHWLPVQVDKQHIFLGISHLTIDFQTVLDIGLNGIKEKALTRLDCFEDERHNFIISCLSAIESFEIWIGRYLEELKSEEGYEQNIKNLSTVPFSPAESFYSAVQSIWAVFAFCRLCGNWPGIGRIDQLLYKYLENDLEKGIITVADAREILAHFFIKGCEWITGEPTESGDAQHYQNIILGGCDEFGNDITNEITYLVLDIVEELGISDFPISVRIGKNTPEKLIKRVAEVMRYGNGIVAVYNEDTVIKALENNGYTTNEARCFANDGCWEVMLPGRTYFNYIPFDALALFQRKTLNSYTDVYFSSFDELYKSYISDLQNEVGLIHKSCIDKLNNKGKLSYAWNESVPCTVISLFENSCIERGLSYTDGGTEYTVYSPHIGGIADVANSLYAIKKLVWDENLLTFKELTDILSNNWEDNEALRLYANSKLSYYGNDNDECDIIVSSIISDFADICSSLEKDSTFKFPAGVSTFGRQVGWAEYRYALPSGQKAGSVLANNMAPTPSSAINGATAIINSYCKADHTKISNGAALDIRLLPNDVKGETGILALCGLIKAFCALGGFFMQIDVADTKILRDAQSNPENYKSLAVRIAGWNARFVTLSKEWQDMIIDNMEKKDGE